MAVALLATPLQAPPTTPIDNEYVRVTRNGAPCAPASPSACGERVLVALGPIEFRQYGQPRRMQRGDVAVFRWHESYLPPIAGDFLEVSIKPDHPSVQAPSVQISPEKPEKSEKIVRLHDAETFFVFEERLAPGETLARHNHGQCLVIVLNSTRLQQWTDGQPEVARAQISNEVRFTPPATHVVATMGDEPLRNIVIEFKP